jgi:hypothetical protein
MSLLRSIFGPGRDELWQRLVTEDGAVHQKGDFWNVDTYCLEQDGWSITLDAYNTGKASYTRLRAPFRNSSGFHFTVSRRSILTPLGALLGLQDVVIGDPSFDHDFVIKSNDEAKVRLLLASEEIRARLAAEPDVHFTIVPATVASAKGRQLDELYFVVSGVIFDVEHLRRLFDLFVVTLEEMARLDLAAIP